MATTYVVRDAFSSDSYVFCRWGSLVEKTLFHCYLDSFRVGDFETDQEVIENVDKRQTAADDLARGVGAVFHVSLDFSKFPRYKDHLYKKVSCASGVAYQKVLTIPNMKAQSSDKLENHNIAMNSEEYSMFLELGGSDWLRLFLSEKIEKRKSK